MMKMEILLIGATTGPHLHLGVRIDEKYIDPLSLFKK